ncbi:hypothetical protein U9M48_021073 [Paspalum notatum var. saurae]|uniref:Uncharacterized protein n=1 Tax=Paspalum notatum var. saurae TaxID=547442 RepID=A0AAQ3THT2_PASNO
MARKCSSCGNNGHNSRTCGGGHGRMFDNGGGVRLFGVQLHVGSSSLSPMKKCFSMECLSSSAAPAYYAAALAAAANNNSSSNNSCSSPSVSPASSLVSVEEAPEKMSKGYLSDGLMGRAHERKKGVPWTEDEHRRFLAGLEKLGKGDWRGISRHFVTTRTPTQVASHAQKYFLRQSSLTHKKRRSSLFDVVENADRAAASAKGHRSRLMRDAAATPTSSSTPPEPTHELPALSLGISVPPPPPPTTTTTARPARALLPPGSLSLQLLPRCSAAMSAPTSSSPMAKQQQQHPPSLALAAPSSKPLPQPDLELKISTVAARPSEPTAGSSPRTPPFLGTIRVT